jgi:hypothetical protein
MCRALLLRGFRYLMVAGMAAPSLSRTREVSDHWRQF